MAWLAIVVSLPTVLAQIFSGKIETLFTNQLAPYNVIGDSQGNIYFSVEANHCIRKLSVANILTTFAGVCGTATVTPDGSLAANTPLSGPLEIFSRLPVH